MEENKKIMKSEEEWKKTLMPEQYHIMREKGTERAFSGKYHDSKEKGVYLCAACGSELFASDTKYDSGTGWPSFYQPISDDRVEYHKDSMQRTEVVCGRCGAHLGHMFDDGPKPTGKRYCVNSLSLKLDKK